MIAPKLTAAVLTGVLVVATVGPAAATPYERSAAYSGSHVAFETTNTAIVEYTVDGETLIESATVQSKSNARNEGDIGIGTDLSAVTDLSASSVSVEATTETGATLSTDSGAEVRANDNTRGVLVVDAGEQGQYVTMNVSTSTRTEREGNRRVVVTTEHGTQGTFIVVGNGSVTVNDRGNVTADLGPHAHLVFRTYTDGRDEADKRQERLIAQGRATAEVYVMTDGETDGDLTTNVVKYGNDTSIEVTQQGRGTVQMTAEREQETGTIVITTVSQDAFGGVEDLQVTVDGDAAARASSYADLTGAVTGEGRSHYLVSGTASADATAEVLVAVNHFSERQITIAAASAGGDGATGTTAGDEGGGSGTSDGSTDGTTTTRLPGFGAGVALIAVITIALLAVRRS